MAASMCMFSKKFSNLNTTHRQNLGRSRKTLFSDALKGLWKTTVTKSVPAGTFLKFVGPYFWHFGRRPSQALKDVIIIICACPPPTNVYFSEC